MGKSWLVAVLLSFVSVSVAQISGVTVLHDFGSGGANDDTMLTGISHGQQVGLWTDYSAELSYPVLWSGSPESRMVMLPKGVSNARITGTFDGQQVGWTARSLNDMGAFLWNSSTTNTVDLHVSSLGPYAFTSTRATGVGGGQQVGVGSGNMIADKAVLWHGTAASAQLLHPDHLGMYTSEARDTDGSQQVGVGRTDPNSIDALLWSGTAGSAISLTPAQATASQAYGVGGGFQVGWARIGGLMHAAVWSGSANTFVDLHPVGATSSRIYATNGIWHVGSYGSAQNERAVMWNAVTHEMVELHAYLPQMFQAFPSTALSIDDLGNVGGDAHSTGSSIWNSRAVVWVVPEPSGFAVLAIGGGFAYLVRRKRSVR